MKKISALIVLLSVLASKEAHAEIRWKPELITVGEYVSIDQSVTGLIHFVYKGRIGGAYVLEGHIGSKPNGPLESTARLDKNGNDLSWENSRGFRIDYQPHNCKRTVGDCTFVQTNSDGEVSSWVRKTVATSKGYRYRLFRKGSNKVVYRGNAELDAFGFAGNGKVDAPQGKQKFTLVGRGNLNK